MKLEFKQYELDKKEDKQLNKLCGQIWYNMMIEGVREYKDGSLVISIYEMNECRYEIIELDSKKDEDKEIIEWIKKKIAEVE